MAGIVGVKIGMSRLYDEKGVATPVTIVKPYQCVVVDVVENAEKDYKTVVLGYGIKKNPEKKIRKPIIGIYKKKGLEPHAKMMSVKVPMDADFKVGDKVDMDRFNVGDMVSVTGVSKGKGFAGGMKRWHFGGLEASHGVSVSHRSLGSTGQREYPGRVFPGKKMPGQLGNKQTTVKNLRIVDLDGEDNLICIKGAIPGYVGSDVLLKTSL